MPPDNIDNSSQNLDNANQNVNDDKNDLVIRLDEQEPLNDPNCEHSFVQDGDKLGDFRGWKCTKCHRGALLHKSITKIT